MNPSINSIDIVRCVPTAIEHLPIGRWPTHREFHVADRFTRPSQRDPHRQKKELPATMSYNLFVYVKSRDERPSGAYLSGYREANV